MSAVRGEEDIAEAPLIKDDEGDSPGELVALRLGADWDQSERQELERTVQEAVGRILQMRNQRSKTGGDGSSGGSGGGEARWLRFYENFCLDRGVGSGCTVEPSAAYNGPEYDAAPLPKANAEQQKEKDRRNCCFNCGKTGHAVKDCPEPFDRKRVREARQKFNDERGDAKERSFNGRFFLELQKSEQSAADTAASLTALYPNTRVGVLSDSLCEALGVASKEPPPWLPRMRRIGVPPDFVLVCNNAIEAKVAEEGEIGDSDNIPSGLVIFDADCAEVTDVGNEEGDAAQVEQPTKRRRQAAPSNSTAPRSVPDGPREISRCRGDKGGGALCPRGWRLLPVCTCRTVGATIATPVPGLFGDRGGDSPPWPAPIPVERCLRADPLHEPACFRPNRSHLNGGHSRGSTQRHNRPPVARSLPPPQPSRIAQSYASPPPFNPHSQARVGPSYVPRGVGLAATTALPPRHARHTSDARPNLGHEPRRFAAPPSHQAFMAGSGGRRAPYERQQYEREAAVLPYERQQYARAPQGMYEYGQRPQQHYRR